MATDPVAECSSSAISTRMHIPRLEQDIEPVTVYDIFLSHSGAQKGFAKDLYKVLSPHYNTFFDIERHSLPPGDHFPTCIFNAAARCRVAVVVLSEEFVSSKWPMLELCTFADAHPSIKILPLFYLLSPRDLKDDANLKRWQSVWNKYAGEDAKCRVDTAKWARAVAALCSYSGLVYDPSEGVLTYLDNITSSIADILSPAIKCDDHLINGKARICTAIVEKFKDMELREAQFPSKSKAFLLGLYGPPGSGKSTMSLFLRDHFSPHFKCKVLYMKLPAENRSFNQPEMVKAFKKLLDLTNFRNRINLDTISDIREVISLLKAYKLPSLRVFLVVDNISDESMKAVRMILDLGVGPGSKVVLVARSPDVLYPALRMQGHRYICDSMSMPGLLEKEAADLLVQTFGAGMGFEREEIDKYLSLRQWEIALKLVRKLGFGLADNMLYLPSVIEKVAEWLLRHNNDIYNSDNQLGRFLECQGMSRVRNYKREVVRELLWESFRALPDHKLQLLFLDIALFILPANIWSASEALQVLSLMHGCSQEKMEAMIEELQRSNFLRISSCGFSLHDVHAEFALSIKEDSTMQFLGSLRHWMIYKCKDWDGVGRDLLLRQGEANNYCQVRTMILEVGEGFKTVNLNGFTSLKALVVRNSKSLEELELVGLTSLVSLDIQTCPNLRWVEAPQEDHSGDLQSTRRVKIWDTDGYIRQEEKSFRLVVQQKSEELQSFSSFRQKGL